MTLIKLAAAPALLAALALSAPASAQRYDSGNELRRDIAQLDRQIDRLQDRRILSQREARALDRRVDGLERTWRSYARNGFSRNEHRTLSSQIARVRYDIDRHARDGDRRPGRPGWR